MRIGFDISQTGSNKAGCGYFADSLIQALIEIDRGNEYILYPHFGTSFWDPDARHSTRKIDRPNVSRVVIGRNFHESMAFWKDMPPDAEERLGNPDVIHANNYSCPKGLKRAKVIYTLHDVNFLEHPEWTTEENRYVCFDGVFAASIYADFIIAVSRYSRDMFLRFFPHYPLERMEVVYLGSRFHMDNFRPQEYPPCTIAGLNPDQFWLAVCTLEPRKNLRRLLKAFALFKGHTKNDFPLVLAGGKGWLEEGLEDFIRQLGLGGSVRILGYVSDEQLEWLYANCFCFVFPSLYEGFGLPVLEAMGFGAAVITSGTTSLPEVGGDAAYYVDPFDVEQMAHALVKMFDDPSMRDNLRAKALERAGLFSWGKSASRVYEIYERVAGLEKRFRG